MRFFSLSLDLALIASSIVAAAPLANKTEQAASHLILDLQRQYQNHINETLKNSSSRCTPETIVYRQEWGKLSKEARIEYSTAVQCLMRKPARNPKSAVPGARSRFDDWSATHINLTNNIHFDGQFFFFHRYFTWLYEKALQEECGYKGTQPYWDWTISWEDPRESTVFDGSAWSMGSNGRCIPHGPTDISAFGINASLAPATGGGCTYSGPFANLTVNLGPVAFKPYGPDHGLGYNPRCLVRDLSPVWSSQLKPTDVIRVLSSFTDLESFDAAFEALNGVHAGGHFTMGGLGEDAFSSSGDPAFYLHHAQVDRVWTIWQNLNAQNRTSQVYGTNTAFNGEYSFTLRPFCDLMGPFPLLTPFIGMTSPAER